MKKLTKLLSAFLVFQLVLVAVVNVEWQSTQVDESGKLLNIASVESVSRMVIGADGQQLTLVKQEDRWVLPQSENLPVGDKKRIKALDTLLSLKRGWAIAKTQSAAQRFEVGGDAYKKRIELFNGDTLLTTLYLGTSPGFRKIHARVKSQDDIYAVELNGFDYGVKAIDWLDKSILSLTADQIQQVHYGDIFLIKHEQQWRLRDQAENESLMKEKVDNLVTLIPALQITGMLNSEQASKYQTQKPLATISVSQGEELVEYRFYLEDDKAVVSSSEYKHWFEVVKTPVEKLKDLNRVALLKPLPETQDQPEVSDTQEVKKDSSS